VERVPAWSNILIASPDAARSFPTGRLDVRGCLDCGMIWNSAFVDPGTPPGGYEASQGCSSTFNQFAKELALRWIDRYSLQGKRIVEIGAGTGEFLAMICKLASAEGVAIEPMVLPAGEVCSAENAILWLSEPLSERHAALHADFVVCRHTLEHIAAAGEFIGGIARICRPGVSVGIEVPDVGRVLEQGAFWDMYYEHCSYFFPGTLAEAFRARGFDPVRVSLEFDRQYVVMEAVRSDERPSPRNASEEPLLRRIELFEAGIQALTAERDHWAAKIREYLRQGRRIVAWGAGSKAVGFLSTLQLDQNAVRAVVDINPRKQGSYLPMTAQSVIAPAELRQISPDVVIVMNSIYSGEIRAQLTSLGLSPELVVCS
jgi:SAM-dependent methyltransferase